MLCQFDLNKFWNERVGPRKQAASSKLRDTMAILTELLRVSTSRSSSSVKPYFRFKDVEQHEPRFVGTLNEVDGRIEGLQFLSPTEIELTLYLNQMGVFNLVDDGTLPGCAALKLRTVSNNLLAIRHFKILYNDYIIIMFENCKK